MAGPSSAHESFAAASRGMKSIPAVRRSAQTHSLAVVIVNFCQWKNTARLVKQLRHSEAIKTRDGEVIVVDNGSPYHHAEGRLRKLRGVRVLSNHENLGFAAAVNRGFHDSDSEWILLLNPDVTVPDGFLDDALLAAENLIRQHPRVGVIGLKLQNRDGTTQPSCGPFPTFKNTIAGVFAPRWKRKCKPLPDEVAPVAWATGGCMLIRRDCIEALAGFDEKFFLYYEDVDFCKRAAEKGFEIWFAPSAVAIHHWPLHSRPVPAPLRLITRHALLTYARNYWPRWQAWLLGRIVRIEGRLRAAWASRAGNPVAAQFYRKMRKLVTHLEAGRMDDVRAMIDGAAEHLAAVAAAQDGRTL